MPMNRDGENRMDGFLHAAADMDSAQPDVQRYREHYRDWFGGRGTSWSGDNMAPGLIGAVLLYGLVYAIGFTAENWQSVLVVGGLLLAIVTGWIVASWRLQDFFPTAVKLLFFVWIASAIWFAAFAAVMVCTGQFATFQDFLASRRPPLSALMAVPIAYAPVVLLVCLTRWARQPRPLWQMVLLANLVFASIPALLFILASRH